MSADQIIKQPQIGPAQRKSEQSGFRRPLKSNNVVTVKAKRGTSAAI